MVPLMKILSAVSASAVMPLTKSRIAATARIKGLFSVIPSQNAKSVRAVGPFEPENGSDQKFFLPSGGVLIESAHTVSAARATLTICSSETATTFRRFYEGEKLAMADQFETGPLTLWRTSSRAGQIGCRSRWPFAAW